MEIEILARAMQDRCILTDREYKLASGAVSHYFYDGKRAMLAGDLKVEIARALFERVRDLHFDIIGGVAVGSVPLSEQMSMLAKLQFDVDYDTFYVRGEKKDHGTETKLYQAHRADSSSAIKPGARALIVDDVITTGASLEIAISELEAMHVEIVAVVVLVDRQDPKADSFRSKYEFRPLFVADPDGNLSPAASPVIA